MTDIALTEWEHQPHVLNVLTSREMGAWLERRDSRLLQEIRQEIEQELQDYSQYAKDGEDYYLGICTGCDDAMAIIDKHIKEIDE